MITSTHRPAGLSRLPGAGRNRRRGNLPREEERLAKIFLRGKVDFLYRRYREDRELTSMILCVASSNQDVNSLPEAVFEWISDSHGNTLRKKGQTRYPVFGSDNVRQKFEEKQGVGEKDEDYVNQWETRLHALCMGVLGKQHDWVEHWTPKQPFNNVFWIRNPNYMAKHIFQYDEQGRETGMVDSPGARTHRQASSGFLGNPHVTRRFKMPNAPLMKRLPPTAVA